MVPCKSTKTLCITIKLSINHITTYPECRLFLDYAVQNLRNVLKSKESFHIHQTYPKHRFGKCVFSPADRVECVLASLVLSWANLFMWIKFSQLGIFQHTSGVPSVNSDTAFHLQEISQVCIPTACAPWTGCRFECRNSGKVRNMSF